MSDQLNMEEVDLEYTRNLRKQLVSEIMTPEGKMPTETKDRMTLLSALDSIDRAALTKMRIKSDEGMNNTKAQAAEALMLMFMDPRMKSKPEVIELGAESVREVPKLPSDLPMPTLVPGELDQSSGNENYNTFMARAGHLEVEKEPGEEDEEE